MGISGLDLPGEGVDIAKAPLERPAGEDGVDTGLFVNPIRNLDGAVNSIARGQAGFHPVEEIDTPSDPARA